MKRSRFLFTFLIISLVFSCEKDTDINAMNQLIGEWVRNDVHEAFEYKLIFYADFTGSKSVKEGTIETTITSSMVSFDWSVKKNILTIEGITDISKTSYSINDEGQLILDSFPNLYFTKSN